MVRSGLPLLALQRHDDARYRQVGPSIHFTLVRGGIPSGGGDGVRPVGWGAGVLMWEGEHFGHGKTNDGRFAGKGIESGDVFSCEKD